MITNLHVKNLALIDEADVSFRPGLNVLTGETGAGKSILLGSIDLALGQKMSGDVIRHGEEQALVELVFEIDRAEVLEKLQELGVETEDGILVLSRKVTDGRSVCRLNGETCTATHLRAVSSLLLDIHGQHEHQSLLYPDRQREILDAFGKEQLDPLRKETEAAYHVWKEARAARDAYGMDEDERIRELSLLEHEIREIEEAALCPGEDEQLEKDYRKMANSKTLVEALQQIHRHTGEDGAADAVSRAVREIGNIVSLDEGLEQKANVLRDIEDLLSDFNRELSLYQEELQFPEDVFRQTEQRLDLLNGLKAKYGRTLEEVQTYLEAQQQRQQQLLHFAEEREAAEAALRRAEEQLEAAAGALSAERKRQAEILSGLIRTELEDLNFLSNQFEIAFDRAAVCRPDGYDEIAFRISTNPGEPLRDLAKIASGGELSRIMLAIKCLLAEKDSTETLLFDEIDTGVSGRTAQKVAEKMAQIAQSHQVLCVTHLAQLAAMADHHFRIQKQVEDGSTVTEIDALTEAGAIEEIARILGGAEITDAVRSNAAEMRSLALEQKRNQMKHQ